MVASFAELGELEAPRVALRRDPGRVRKVLLSDLDVASIKGDTHDNRDVPKAPPRSAPPRLIDQQVSSLRSSPGLTVHGAPKRAILSARTEVNVMVEAHDVRRAVYVPKGDPEVIHPPPASVLHALVD
jgi:hypothetical protein